MTFNSSRLDSRKLVPTQKPTRKFGQKFGMQDPTSLVLFFILTPVNPVPNKSIKVKFSFFPGRFDWDP